MTTNGMGEAVVFKTTFQRSYRLLKKESFGFEVSAEALCPQPECLTAQSVDFAGLSAFWEVSWGDGTIERLDGLSGSFAHAYATPGVKDIELFVRVRSRVSITTPTLQNRLFEDVINHTFLSGASVTAAAPIPEPENHAMMGLSLGLLGWVGRRKKLKEAATA